MTRYLLPLTFIAFAIVYDLFVTYYMKFDDDRGMPCVVILCIPFAMYFGLKVFVEVVQKPGGLKALVIGCARNLAILLALTVGLYLCVRFRLLR